MDELAALRAAVYAAPDDDAPRLVLGDYLIERGQPVRGELIHVQCKIAAGDRSEALAAREKELLTAMKLPPRYAASYDRGVARGSVDTRWVNDELLQFLGAEPIFQRFSIGPCGGGGDERIAIVKRVLLLVLDRIRELQLDNAAWKMPSGRITYIPFGEEFDDRDKCTAMLASLPPRPATLVELYAYEVELPAAWQR